MDYKAKEMDDQAAASLKNGKIDGEKVNFDEDILGAIKPMGRFQARVIAWGTTQDIPIAMNIMFFLFAAANPGFSCIYDHGAPNSTTGELNECSMNGSSCSARLYENVSLKSIISEWDLVCERQVYSTYISTALMIGLLLGATIASHLADMYGRKRVVFPMAALMAVNQILTCTAVSWQMMLIFRLICGFLTGGVIVINATLPMELTNGRWRGICLCSNGWPLGTMLLVLLAYFIRDWQHLAVATGVCGLPVLLFWFVVPESPRWLIQRGRFDDAKSVLKWMARVNRRPEPDYSLLPMIASRCQQQEADEKYTFLDLFHTKRMATNVCVLGLFSFTCSACFYVVAFNASQLSGDRYINALILAAFEQVFNFALMVAIHWIGRKKCGVGFMLFGGICLCMMNLSLLTKDNAAASNAITAIVFFGRGAISGAWVMAWLLASELFPTLIRTTASGFSSMCSRVGGAVAPYIAYLFFVHPSIPYVITGVMSVAAAVTLMLSVPETSRLPMPEQMPHKARSLMQCCKTSKEKCIDDKDGDKNQALF